MGAVHWPRRDCWEQHPHTRVCAHTHMSHTHTRLSHTHTHTAVTFLVPGQEPGAGDAGGAVGQRVGPAGELVEGAVTDQLCGGTGGGGALGLAPRRPLSPRSPSRWDPAWLSPVGAGRRLMLRWHSSLYAFQLSKRKSVIWAEGPWRHRGVSPTTCPVHPPCRARQRPRLGDCHGRAQAVPCHSVPCCAEGLPRAGVAQRQLGDRQRAGCGAEHHGAGCPVLTWQQSSSRRRLRRHGWDIPLPGHEPHGEQRRALGFLPALGSSSALAARALARGRPCTRHRVTGTRAAGPVPGQSRGTRGRGQAGTRGEAAPALVTAPQSCPRPRPTPPGFNMQMVVCAFSR